MFTPSITTLLVGAAAPLLASIEVADGVTRWRRVGVITRTATRLQVELDACARFFLPAWEACAAATMMPKRRFARIRFGVFCGRAGVAVIAVGALTPAVRTAISTWARQLAAARVPSSVTSRDASVRSDDGSASR